MVTGGVHAEFNETESSKVGKFDKNTESRTTRLTSITEIRNKNEDLSRVLMAGECVMWKKIRNGDYSWLKIKSDKKKLFRLIDIYSNFGVIVDSVKDLNEKVVQIKKLKDTPVNSE